MRLRQAVLAARDLDAAVDAATTILGTTVTFRDPAVAVFGLVNAVMPIGDTFLEIVSPVGADAPAARFLARHGGDAGYMVMLQTDDLATNRRRARELSIREVFETALDDIAAVHLHPRDVGGTLLSLDQPTPPAAWRWAGPAWENSDAARRDRHLRAVHIASESPRDLAERWAAVLVRSVRTESGDSFVIELDDGSQVRFAPANAANEGLVGVDIAAEDRTDIHARARAYGAPMSHDGFTLCGTRFRILDI